MVTTVRGRRQVPGAAVGVTHDDNIIVWADDPAGDWSEPVILIDENGIIDPSLFFDDDGKVYYMANARAPALGLKAEDAPWAGWREIWMQELDLAAMALVGARTTLWNGALKNASTPEAPHIYKVAGAYYLLIGEAGTFHDHAVTIARADSVRGPYEGSPRNPILTHRHLGVGHPITSTGAHGPWGH
jgi:alpha-N-arabinofuranosidase